MDPTFAGHMRRYLAATIAEHVLTRSGTCACGDKLEDGSLADHVLDVITLAFAEPGLAPHVVHVDDAIELDEPYYRVDGEDPDGKRRAKDENGKPIKVTGRRHVGPTDCPDCSRGLSSRDYDLVCPRVDQSLELRGCHEGCIVACGEGLTDG